MKTSKIENLKMKTSKSRKTQNENLKNMENLKMLFATQRKYLCALTNDDWLCSSFITIYVSIFLTCLEGTA